VPLAAKWMMRVRWPASRPLPTPSSSEHQAELNNPAAPVRIRSFLAAVLLILSAGAALGQDKVNYHFDNAVTQGPKGLRNVRPLPRSLA
jgi:hypothetical protein